MHPIQQKSEKTNRNLPASMLVEYNFKPCVHRPRATMHSVTDRQTYRWHSRQDAANSWS